MKSKVLLFRFFIMGLLLLIICPVPNCFSCSHPPPDSLGKWIRCDWGYTSNMVCTNIVPQWDASCFHYKTETCPLKVKEVYDRDLQMKADGTTWCSYHGEYTTKYDWVEDPCDYHDCDLCDWSGEGVVDINGHTATYDRSEFGPTGESGTEITFTMDDKTTVPSPVFAPECNNTIDDEGPYVTPKLTLYAFEAVAYLNCTTSNAGSPNTIVHEYGGSDDDIFINLNKAEVGAYDDEDSNEISAFGTATWSLRILPANAYLSSGGNLKVPIDVNASGQLVCSVRDDDIDMSGVTVGVSLTGGAGWGAGVSISIDTGGGTEGSAGAGFAFSSDLLNDDTNDEIEISSGDFSFPFSYTPKYTETCNYGYARGVDFETPNIGATTLAKAQIKGQCYTEEEVDYIALAEVSCGAGTGDGGVTYGLEVPTYEGGTFTQHPDW